MAYGPGLHFCRRCGLVMSMADPPPRDPVDWWRWYYFLLAAVFALGVAWSVVDSPA